MLLENKIHVICVESCIPKWDFECKWRQIDRGSAVFLPLDPENEDNFFSN